MTDVEKEYLDFAKHMEERFPEMFKEQRYGGFAVGKGWWPMLETLCAVIQSHTKNNNERRARLLEKNEYNQTIPEEITPVKIEQIKEKFGTLRFYYQGGDEFIRGATWLAESMSGMLCEECGAPGERRGGGWVRTLCDKHEAERQAMYEEQARKDGLEL